MKEKQSVFNPGWMVAVMIAGMVAVQMWGVPAIGDACNGQLSIYLTVALVALFLLILIPLCHGAKNARLPDRKQSVPWLGGAAVMAGVGMLITNVGYAVIWKQQGTTPPPVLLLSGKVDYYALVGTLTFGTLGGVALVVLGLKWIGGKSVRTAGMSWGTLLPLLWAFCRLIRYTDSYTSTIRNVFSFPNAAMLILSLAFFLQFGRHLLGRGGEGQSWSLTVLSFGTAITGISTPLVRILFTKLSPDYIDGVIQMADASDFCVGLLALAVGCYLCLPEAKCPLAEPEAADYEPQFDEITEAVEDRFDSDEQEPSESREPSDEV